MGRDYFVCLLGGNHALENAQVGVDGEVVIGDIDGAFDGSAEETHFGGQGKREGGTLPALLLGDDLYGKAGALEEVVERAIDGADDFFLGPIVRDGDAHQFHLDGSCRAGLAPLFDSREG